MSPSAGEMRVVYKSGVIVRTHPANERRRYIVTPSLIGWADTQNDPWYIIDQDLIITVPTDVYSTVRWQISASVMSAYIFVPVITNDMF